MAVSDKAKSKFKFFFYGSSPPSPFPSSPQLASSCLRFSSCAGHFGQAYKLLPVSLLFLYLQEALWHEDFVSVRGFFLTCLSLFWCPSGQSGCSGKYGCLCGNVGSFFFYILFLCFSFSINFFRHKAFVQVSCFFFFVFFNCYTESYCNSKLLHKVLPYNTVKVCYLQHRNLPLLLSWTGSRT